MAKNTLEYFLKIYLENRPLFLSLIRSKEALLYQTYLPFKRPVLDIGCGDGFFANIAFAKNFKFQISNFKLNKRKFIDVGLDLEESRITDAQKKGVYKKLVTYDGKTFPFADNSFSTVISNCVLEHIPNLGEVVSEIWRVLKPKGLFLTTVMAKPWEEDLLGALVLGDYYRNWMRKKQIHHNLLDKKGWDKVFVGRGYTILKCAGYLSPFECRLIDMAHYLSFPSLISYTLFKKWVLFPQITEYIYPRSYLARILSEKVKAEESGALFYVMKKHI